MESPPSEMSWLVYAIASGACAALNGALAKLTTTSLTSSWATTIARSIGFEGSTNRVDFGVRGAFFLCNLAFNGVMWGLFTRALTLANSTVRVSVINTSANFVITALLGFVVFGESLPALWWFGAAMLVAGSVIIGRRDEPEKPGPSSETEGSQKDAVSVTSNRQEYKKVGNMQTSEARKRLPSRLGDDW